MNNGIIFTGMGCYIAIPGCNGTFWNLIRWKNSLETLPTHAIIGNSKNTSSLPCVLADRIRQIMHIEFPPPECQIGTVLIGPTHAVIPLRMGAVGSCDLIAAYPLRGRKLPVMVIRVDPAVSDLMGQSVKVHFVHSFCFSIQYMGENFQSKTCRFLKMEYNKKKKRR